MAPGDWPPRDGDDASTRPEDQSERVAAVDAAREILAGPNVVVPRALLLQLTALLREAQRLLERGLDEGSTGTGTQPADDDLPASEQEGSTQLVDDGGVDHA